MIVTLRRDLKEGNLLLWWNKGIDNKMHYKAVLRFASEYFSDEHRFEQSKVEK